MAWNDRDLDSYVDVATRIAEFRDRYPDGSLQPWGEEPWRLVQAQGIDRNGEVVQQTFIVYVAAAYRTPTDPRPGVGAAWEVFPGRTNFTRGSELQNAETSAWGRAIVAALASDSKVGVASREEVRNRRAEQEERGPGRPYPQDVPSAPVTRTPVTGAEHERLRNGAAGATAPEDRAKVTRLRQPGEDPWQDQPAGEGLPVDKDAPGTIGPGQLRRLQTVYQGMDRINRLADISEKIHRQVNSAKALSFNEAARLLETVGS